MAKFSIYKYVRKGWRYCKAVFHANGKIKPNVVVVSGVEEKHTEGRYFLNFNSARRGSIHNNRYNGVAPSLSLTVRPATYF